MDILDPRTPVKNAVLIYILITLFILHHRPEFIFTQEGRCQSFGLCKPVNEKKNILTLVMIVTSVTSYLLFSVINILHHKNS
tara:strand:+ start:1083 stop:1328 length:246 start_codon:yes stop_codon:yes gene_type:complete